MIFQEIDFVHDMSSGFKKKDGRVSAQDIDFVHYMNYGYKRIAV